MIKNAFYLPGDEVTLTQLEISLENDETNVQNCGDYDACQLGDACKNSGFLQQNCGSDSAALSGFEASHVGPGKDCDWCGNAAVDTKFLNEAGEVKIIRVFVLSSDTCLPSDKLLLAQLELILENDETDSQNCGDYKGAQTCDAGCYCSLL